MATGDRLTVQLEDGRGAQLRTLAGGERKVGAYLSDVINWLWFNRDTLAGADIAQFSPMTPERQAQVEKALDNAQQKYDSAQQALDSAKQALSTVEQAAQEMQRQMEGVAAMQEELKARQIATEAQLAKFGYVPLAWEE